MRSHECASASVIERFACPAWATSRLTKNARWSSNNAIAIRIASQPSNAAPCQDRGVASGESEKGGAGGKGEKGEKGLKGGAGLKGGGVGSTGTTAGACVIVSVGRMPKRGMSMTGGDTISISSSAAGSGIVSTYSRAKYKTALRV